MNKKRKLDEKKESTGGDIDGAKYKEWLLQTIRKLPPKAVLQLFGPSEIKDLYLHIIKDCKDIISNVPQEIGLMIFSYGVESSFRRVCKRWKELCEIVLMKEFETLVDDLNLIRRLLIFQGLLYINEDYYSSYEFYTEEKERETEQYPRIISHEVSLYFGTYGETFLLWPLGQFKSKPVELFREKDEYLLGFRTKKSMRLLVLQMPLNHIKELKLLLTVYRNRTDDTLFSVFKTEFQDNDKIWGHLNLVDSKTQQRIKQDENIKNHFFHLWVVLYTK